MGFIYQGSFYPKELFTLWSFLLYGAFYFMEIEQKLCQQQNGTANAGVRLLQLHIANPGGFFHSV
ncbi:MAG: hypothetical protein P8P17_07130, partial [Pseudomonadales bacterium]|nr:hypothetical protein [Pseudomonadales bacterium]